jgi:hypothetical protein
MSPTDSTPDSKLNDARTKDGLVPEPAEGHKHHPHDIVQRGQVAHLEEPEQLPDAMPVETKETLHSTADKSK